MLDTTPLLCSKTPVHSAGRATGDARRRSDGAPATPPGAPKPMLASLNIPYVLPPLRTPMDRVLLIAPGLTDRQYWRDLWRYRELLIILAWRDVTVRYKQTLIGVAWALLRPLLTLIIFTLVFSRIAKLPVGIAGDMPYALMVYAGLLAWQFFATVFGDASNSLIDNPNLITKVYFPRLLIPASTAAAAFVEFAVGLCLFMGLMLWYVFVPGWQLVLLPVFILFALVASLGPGLLIAALNVKYRDFRYVVPFLIQIGMYISPVGFNSALVSPRWQIVFALNPMVGVIDGFRWCLLDGRFPLHPAVLATSCTTALLLLALGLRTFRRLEKQFADLV